MAFSFTEIDFKCRVTKQPRQPFFLGPPLRGSLGAWLKVMTCNHPDTSCEACDFKRDCPYHQIFEPQPLKNPSQFKGLMQGPSALLLKIFRDTWSVSPGFSGNLLIRIVLLGRAIRFSTALIAAMRVLGKVGVNGLEYIVEGVESGLNQHLPPESRWQGELTQDPPEMVVENLAGSVPGTVQLTLDSPLRLEKQGRILGEITPGIFITYLSRRIQLMNDVHGDGKPFYNYKEVLDAAKNIEPVITSLVPVSHERRSMRQQRQIPMDGYMGKIIWKNVPEKIGQLLLLGEVVQIGKSTNMGYGNFRLEYPALSKRVLKKKTRTGSQPIGVGS